MCVCVFSFSPPNFSPWWWSSLSALEAAAAAPAIAICTMYIYMSYIKSRSLATGMHTVNLFGTMDEMFIIIFGLPAWWWFSGFRHRFANYIHQHQQKDYPLILSFFPCSVTLSLFSCVCLGCFIKTDHSIPLCSGWTEKEIPCHSVHFFLLSLIPVSFISVVFPHVSIQKRRSYSHKNVHCLGTQIAHC